MCKAHVAALAMTFGCSFCKCRAAAGLWEDAAARASTAYTNPCFFQGNIQGPFQEHKLQKGVSKFTCVAAPKTLGLARKLRKRT